MTIRTLVLPLLFLAVLSSTAVADFQLTDSDRVVFYGDRMTKLPEIGHTSAKCSLPRTWGTATTS